MGWTHVPILDLFAENGVPLLAQGRDKYVGPHPHRHDSKSGRCLVVWSARGLWWYSSCKAKGDARDFLVDIGKAQDRREAETILTEKYGPPPTEWPVPVPFPDWHGPDFPIERLPPTLGQFVKEEAEALQVPLDLPGVQSLAAVSAVSADKATVYVKNGWLEPLNEYFIAALDSGERKSPSDRDVRGPLEELQKEMADEAMPEIAKRQTAREILESQLNQLKKDAAKPKLGADERTVLTEQAQKLAVELAKAEVPVPPRLLCDDVTSEAPASLLAENRGRIAMFSTEGGIFETMAGRYSEGHLSIDVYLKAYSGDPLRVDRKGRRPEFVAKPKLTMCLCVQPDVIRNLATKPGFRGRGLLARPLYALPKSEDGRCCGSMGSGSAPWIREVQ